MKAGLKQIIAGVLLFGCGVICVPLVLVKMMARDSVDLVEFEVPGSAIAFVDTPGRYYLWHDYQTVYDGRSYDHPVALPAGVVIELIGKGGVPLNFVSATHTSLSLNGRARQSLGYIEVAEAGQVSIQVSGLLEPHVVSFSPFSFGRFAELLVKGLLCAGAIAVASLGLILWGIVTLANAPRGTPVVRG